MKNGSAYAESRGLGRAAVHSVRYEQPFVDVGSGNERVRLKSRVGVPIAEALLTEEVLARPHDLVSVGRGYALIVLDEVELTFGRPDIVIATVSANALSSWLRRGIRLANATEARVLATMLDPNEEKAIAVTREHARAVRKRLESAGWSLTELPTIPVREALVLEAKIADWRTGITQLTARQSQFNSSALLVPEPVGHRVPHDLLEWDGIGLAVQCSDGKLRWQRKPRARAISMGARIWISQLVANRFASGLNYGPRPSVLRNSATAIVNGASKAS